MESSSKLQSSKLRQIRNLPAAFIGQKSPSITESIISYIAKKAGGRGNRIRNPRHFLLYRGTESAVVEIGRVLHDSMELKQHVPEEYRNPAGRFGKS
jgi:hypothetical protein